MMKKRMTFFSPPNGNYLLNASRCDLEESHIPTTRLKPLPCKFSRLGCSGCGFAPWFVEALFTGCVHLLGDQRCWRPLPRPGRCESAASSALIQLRVFVLRLWCSGGRCCCNSRRRRERVIRLMCPRPEHGQPKLTLWAYLQWAHKATSSSIIQHAEEM